MSGKSRPPFRPAGWCLWSRNVQPPSNCLSGRVQFFCAIWGFSGLVLFLLCRSSSAVKEFRIGSCPTLLVLLWSDGLWPGSFSALKTFSPLPASFENLPGASYSASGPQSSCPLVIRTAHLIAYLVLWLLWGLNKLIVIECLEQWPAHSKRYKNVGSFHRCYSSS